MDVLFPWYVLCFEASTVAHELSSFCKIVSMDGLLIVPRNQFVVLLSKNDISEWNHIRGVGLVSDHDSLCFAVTKFGTIGSDWKNLQATD